MNTKLTLLTGLSLVLASGLALSSPGEYGEHYTVIDCENNQPHRSEAD